jgi:hypothetical protein
MLKMDLGEGDADDLLGGMIQVSDLKICCPEFSVPAGPVEEPLYGNHEWAIGILSPPRRSMEIVLEIGRIAQLLKAVKSIMTIPLSHRDGSCSQKTRNRPPMPLTQPTADATPKNSKSDFL